MESKKNVGDTLKYKLTNVWGVIQRSGKNKFRDKTEFLEWAEESKYKPWKSLSLIDDNEGYSVENCMWKIDKRFSGGIRSIEEDDSQRNLCRIIKSCVGSLEENKINLMMCRQLMGELNSTKRIGNKTKLSDALMDLDRALMSVRSSLNLIDDLDILEENDAPSDSK